MPGVSVEQVKERNKGITSRRKLIDEYAAVHNKFWFLELGIYNYQEQSSEHKDIWHESGKWAELMNELYEKVMVEVEKVGYVKELCNNDQCRTALTRFMGDHGYGDADGWWKRYSRAVDNYPKCGCVFSYLLPVFFDSIKG